MWRYSKLTFIDIHMYNNILQAYDKKYDNKTYWLYNFMPLPLLEKWGILICTCESVGLWVYRSVCMPSDVCLIFFKTIFCKLGALGPHREKTFLTVVFRSNSQRSRSNCFSSKNVVRLISVYPFAGKFLNLVQ